MISFTLNGKAVEFQDDPDTPLLWALREHFALTGSKYGCGQGLCGACTVHVDSLPQRACQLPMRGLAGRQVVTIEGLSDKVGQALQQAWQDLNVAQCGYCQSGQLMSASSLLRANNQPTRADIASAMDGNLCRCATYNRISAAIELAAKRLGGQHD